MPRIFFPVVWGEQTAVLPRRLRIYLKMFLMLPYVITGVAVIFISLGFYMLIRLIFRSKLTTSYKKTSKKKRCLLISREEKVPLQHNINVDKTDTLAINK